MRAALIFALCSAGRLAAATSVVVNLNCSGEVNAIGDISTSDCSILALNETAVYCANTLGCTCDDSGSGSGSGTSSTGTPTESSGGSGTPSPVSSSACGHSESECLAYDNTEYDETCIYGGVGCSAWGMTCCKMCGTGIYDDCTTTGSPTPAATNIDDDDAYTLCGHDASECIGTNIKFDSNCLYGGLGCSARGMTCCRLCGTGLYSSIPCDNVTAAPTIMTTTTTSTTTTTTTTLEPTAVAIPSPSPTPSPTLGCLPSEKATCTCYGDPHCYTFDNTFHTYQGLCSYKYVAPCESMGYNLSDFPVEVLANHWECGPSVACLDNLYVRLYDSETATFIREIVISFDGDVYDSYSNESINSQKYYYGDNNASWFEVSSLDGKVQLDIYTGKHITWTSALSEITVRRVADWASFAVSECWQDQLCGVCGYFSDDNGADDFVLQNGTQLALYPPDPSDMYDEQSNNAVWTFANSWVDTERSIANGGYDKCLQSMGEPVIACNGNSTLLSLMNATCKSVWDAAAASCPDMSTVSFTNWLSSCVFDSCIWCYNELLNGEGITSDCTDLASSYLVSECDEATTIATPATCPHNASVCGKYGLNVEYDEDCADGGLGCSANLQTCCKFCGHSPYDDCTHNRTAAPSIASTPSPTDYSASDIDSYCGHTQQTCEDFGASDIIFDISCGINGGLGCSARGVTCCRYCGTGVYSSISCAPTTAPTPIAPTVSPTQHPSPATVSPSTMTASPSPVPSINQDEEAICGHTREECESSNIIMDVNCALYGGLGCSALGKTCCRYCGGDGIYSGISCAPSTAPTMTPTANPASHPTRSPSTSPSNYPSLAPSMPTAVPSMSPSMTPSSTPTDDIESACGHSEGHCGDNPNVMMDYRCFLNGGLGCGAMGYACCRYCGTGVYADISCAPTTAPTRAPSQQPSMTPSQSPSSPTNNPTLHPSMTPSKTPTKNPSESPTNTPSLSPSLPSLNPTLSPTLGPSTSPTVNIEGNCGHSESDCGDDSNVMLDYNCHLYGGLGCGALGYKCCRYCGTGIFSDISCAPTHSPTSSPSFSPSTAPSGAPTSPSTSPTMHPSHGPSTSPTRNPSDSPTLSPSNNPSLSPSDEPTLSPSLPTLNPTLSPTMGPTTSPTVDIVGNCGHSEADCGDDDNVMLDYNCHLYGGLGCGALGNKCCRYCGTGIFSEISCAPTHAPTSVPSPFPSAAPSSAPSDPSASPTLSPTNHPSLSPSESPSRTPSNSPSRHPTTNPSEQPSVGPSPKPTSSPTLNPSENPSEKPTQSPSQSPSRNPSYSPSDSPTQNPSKSPSRSPSSNPTGPPTQNPSNSPSQYPTDNPSDSPTISPSEHPSVSPIPNPSHSPSHSPSPSPTDTPTESPTDNPSVTPSVSPSAVTPGPTTNLSSCETSSYRECDVADVGWNVTFEQQTYSPSSYLNWTCFNYEVTVQPPPNANCYAQDTSLTHFTIGIPTDCAVDEPNVVQNAPVYANVYWSPITGEDSDTCVFGNKFTSDTGPWFDTSLNTSASFKVCYSGADWTMAMGEYAVHGGKVFATGSVMVPMYRKCSVQTTPSLAPTIAPTYDSSPQCQTAFARDNATNQCFLDLLDSNNSSPFMRWGWVNGPFVGIGAGMEPISMPVYAGAGACRLGVADLDGTCTLSWNDTANTPYLTFNATPPALGFEEFHIYYGESRLPMNNGEETVSPGHYTIVHEVDEGLVTSQAFPLNVSSFDLSTNGLYVVAHAVSCRQ